MTEQVRERGDNRVVLVMHQSVTDPNDVENGTTKQFYDDLLASGDVALVVHGHLDEYVLHSVHDVPVLQCGTFETQRTYTLVTYDGQSFEFERCRFGDCEPVTPEPEESTEATP